MEALDIMLKEYETLRQESLDTMNNRSQIVSFGLATIGVIIAAAFSLDRAERSLSLNTLIFSAGIPSLSVLILYIWLGEVERMMRVGDYLRGLEARINALADRQTALLQWEQWLRTSTKQMRYPYIVVIGLFFGLAFGAPVVGEVVMPSTCVHGLGSIGVPWLLMMPIVLHVYRRTRSFK